MDRECKDCQWFAYGVTDEQRHKWDWSNWGQHADGVCNLYFPRGYVGRKPPHPAMSTGHCFQWEERSGQITFDDLEVENERTGVDKEIP